MANQQGWGQQTPAIRSILSSAMGAVRRATTKRRTKSRSASASGVKRSPKRSRKGRSSSAGRVLKAGSAAAKAWGKRMAKLRKRK